jgi:hypothetical protein
MVLADLSVPTDARTGDAIRFSAEFRQIQIVTNARTVITVPRAKKRVNRGVKIPKDPEFLETTSAGPAPRFAVDDRAYRYDDPKDPSRVTSTHVRDLSGATYQGDKARAARQR